MFVILLKVTVCVVQICRSANVTYHLGKANQRVINLPAREIREPTGEMSPVLPFYRLKGRPGYRYSWRAAYLRVSWALVATL